MKAERIPGLPGRSKQERLVDKAFIPLQGGSTKTVTLDDAFTIHHVGRDVGINVSKNLHLSSLQFERDNLRVSVENRGPSLHGFREAFYVPIDFNPSPSHFVCSDLRVSFQAKTAVSHSASDVVS